MHEFCIFKEHVRVIYKFGLVSRTFLKGCVLRTFNEMKIKTDVEWKNIGGGGGGGDKGGSKLKNGENV